MLTLGLTREQALLVVLGLIILTSFISTMSGLWGVLVTDAFQFFVKMGMVIALAVYAVKGVGGMDAMKVKLAAIDAARGGSGSVMNFVPDLQSSWMPLIAFLTYISVQWWAAWYPGAEPGGGGYVAQRMFCAKDERHSLLATLWFNVAHYAIRPWPWVLVGLCSLILYPDLPDANKGDGYIMVMVDFLPPSLRGLMIAAFAAAYMSTIATQLNWGASYVVNDFYKRFINPKATDRQYVVVSQWATVGITLGSIVVSYFFSSISGAWQLLISIGAGTGLVLLLRWYWWRINAWSEVAAMMAALVVSLTLQFGFGKLDENPEANNAKILLITVAFTTAAWIIATFVTKPESDATLINFYRRTRPSIWGWGPIAAKAPEVKPTKDGIWNFVDWIAGCVMVYAALFGVGKIIFGETALGIGLLVLAAASAFVIYWDLNRRGWSTVVD